MAFLKSILTLFSEAFAAVPASDKALAVAGVRNIASGVTEHLLTKVLGPAPAKVVEGFVGLAPSTGASPAFSPGISGVFSEIEQGMAGSKTIGDGSTIPGLVAVQ